MTSSRRGFCLVLALSVVGLTLVTAPTASADPHGYPVPGYVPDNMSQGYCYGAGVTAGNQPYIDSSMQYLAAATNMVAPYESYCSDQTDAVWIEMSDPEIAGFTPCVRWRDKAAAVCDSFWVGYSPTAHFNWLSQCGGDSTIYLVNLVATMRHELGHSVSLSHTAAVAPACSGIAGDDAMTSDWINYNTWAYWDYNSHHIGHVNCRCSGP